MGDAFASLHSAEDERIPGIRDVCSLAVAAVSFACTPGEPLLPGLLWNSSLERHGLPQHQTAVTPNCSDTKAQIPREMESQGLRAGRREGEQAERNPRKGEGEMELSRAEEAAGAPGKPQPHLGLIQVELPWLLSLLCSECSRLEQGSSPSPSLTCSRHWDVNTFLLRTLG